MLEIMDCIYRALVTSTIRLLRSAEFRDVVLTSLGTITFQSQDVGTPYQSLQTKLEPQVADGITGLISYTWSKFMQSNQAPALGGNTGHERICFPFNTPQNLAMSGSYQLPVDVAESTWPTATILWIWYPEDGNFRRLLFYEAELRTRL
jgi:hypothetical protein